MYNQGQKHSLACTNNWLFLPLTLLLCGYYFFIGNSATFGFGDEGYLYYLAWSLLDGRLPYKDFELGSYPPGVFLYYSLFFKSFGVSIEAGRIASVVLIIANCWLCYRLVKKTAGTGWALLAAFVIGTMPGPWHKVYVGTLCLAALLGAMRIHERNSLVDHMFSGAVIALGFQFRLDAAVCGVIMYILAVIGKRWDHMLLKNMGTALLVGFLTMLPMLTFLGANDLMGDYVAQLANYFSLIVERNNAWYKLPLPDPGRIAQEGVFDFTALFYSSFLVITALALILTFQLKEWLRDKSGDIQLILLLFVWVALSTPQYAFERPDASHLYQRGFIFIVGASFLLGKSGLSGQPRIPLLQPFRVILFLFLILYCLVGLKSPAGGGLAWRPAQPEMVTPSTGIAFKQWPGSSWGTIASYIDNHRNKFSTLAAIPYAPGMNFVLQLHSPGRKIHFFPNVIRSKKEDSTTASEVSRADFVILLPNMKLAPGPRTALGCYAPLLSEEINKGFHPVMDFRRLILLQPGAENRDTSERIVPKCSVSQISYHEEYTQKQL